MCDQHEVTVKRAAVAGMYSDYTCGPNCWYAREETCRCSCAGKNHGCLLVEGAEQPTREAKIDGERYKLEAVGRYIELTTKAALVNAEVGWHYIVKPEVDAQGRPIPGSHYHYSYKETEAGAPARLRPATNPQILNWPELAHTHTWTQHRPYLLWVRVSPPEPQWCADPKACSMCSNMLDRITRYKASIEAFNKENTNAD